MPIPPQLVFTGSYAPASDPGVRAFAFDPASGQIAARGETRGIVAPSFIAVHPSGRWLYAVSETSTAVDHTAGHVHAFGLERGGDAVQFISLNLQPSGGDFPCHLGFDPLGEWLLVTNYGSGTIGVLPIHEDGSLGEPGEPIRHEGRGPHPERQDGPHTHSTIFAPDGRFVVAADLGIDTLAVYRFADGRLTKAADVRTAPGAGPRHMAFHPNGRVLYVVNELGSTLTAYDYGEGRLTERETLSTLPEESPENLAADLHMSAAGDRVYVSNRGHNSLAVYATAEGALTRLALASCGGNWPRNFALSPDGRFILAANQYSGEVATLPLCPGGEEISAPAARVPVPDVTCVAFAPETH